MNHLRTALAASILGFAAGAPCPQPRPAHGDFLAGLETALRSNPELVRTVGSLKETRAELAALHAEKRELKTDSKENRDRIRVVNARIDSAEKAAKTLDRTLERSIDTFLDGVYATSPELQAFDLANRLQAEIAGISVATDRGAFRSDGFTPQGLEKCSLEIPCGAGAPHATTLFFGGKSEASAVAADLAGRLASLFGNPVPKAEAKKHLLRTLDPGNR